MSHDRKHQGGKWVRPKITAVDRKTGKEDRPKSRQIEQANTFLEWEYPAERSGSIVTGGGLNSIIRRLVNDIKRQVVSPEYARAMRAARKVADHPYMQEKTGLGGRISRPLDDPSSKQIRERMIREMSPSSP